VKRFILVLVIVGLASAAGTAGAGQRERPPVDRDHVGAVGWPVWPVDVQHPIRGGFLDPRPTTGGVTLHTGVDISVRDDLPEADHPWLRTHRVYALEGGTVELASDVERRSCTGRLVRVGHFTYAHVDPVGTVAPGEVVNEGDVVGWTCKGNWHVHVTERADTPEGRVVVNPLRPNGRLRPYVDTAPPVVRALEFTRPDDGVWLVIGDVVASLSTGAHVPASRLRGSVEIRASIADRQSFLGWFAARPYLQTELTPYEVRESLRRRSGALVWEHVSFRSDVWRPRGASLAPRYAPGTVQNLPAQACVNLQRRGGCGGESWFSLGGPDGGRTWDTRTVPNGAYELCVIVRDALTNVRRQCRAIRVAN
jgi:hypothetical protein